MQQSFKNNKNTLYIIPTPIGNLKDISKRVIETIKDCAIIACEDTRVTGKLLASLNIKIKMVVFADHNSKESIKNIMDSLVLGNVGLISDAGMPLISDPGIDLVRVVAQKYNVTSIPGPTAFINALVVSGLDTNMFTFFGFLPNKETQRLKMLENIKNKKETLIFYESSHRINKCLDNMFRVFGDRSICVCRELTKMHEEIHRDKLPLKIMTEKGEFCIVVEGFKKVKFNEDEIISQINLLKNKGISNKDIVKQLSNETKESRNNIYTLVNKKDQ